jgi:polysaccharide pyruvyl transferase WcaK-like protein
MTGTGMITDTHESSFGMPYQMFKWTVLSRLWRRRIAFVSAGAEGLNDRLHLFFLGWSLRLAHYRSYRDPLSKQRAVSLYSGASTDPVYPDLAFSLDKSLAAPAKPVFSGPRTVAIGIYAVESGLDAVKSYVEEIGTFVLWVLERGYQPRIVIGDAEYDEDIRVDLIAWLERKNVAHKVLSEHASSFQELMAQLAQADFVVATRFHNVLLSLLLEKPVVSVSHMDKNDQLMAAMGLGAYCLPLVGMRHSDVVAKFRELEENSDQVRVAIGQKLASFRERLEEQYARIFGDLRR